MNDSLTVDRRIALAVWKVITDWAEREPNRELFEEIVDVICRERHR